MDKRTGLILIAVSSILCGLPGLCGICLGSVSAWGATLPDATVEDPALSIGLGLAMLGVGLLFLAIPVIIWLVVLRQRPVEKAVSDFAEPIPDEDF
jgi:hypothetical protein